MDLFSIPFLRDFCQSFGIFIASENKHTWLNRHGAIRESNGSLEDPEKTHRGVGVQALLVLLFLEKKF
jgi:hypothetical protein